VLIMCFFQIKNIKSQTLRLRLRQNDAAPCGSGSATLVRRVKKKLSIHIPGSLFLIWNILNSEKDGKYSPDLIHLASTVGFRFSPVSFGFEKFKIKRYIYKFRKISLVSQNKKKTKLFRNNCIWVI
jgi:hypothetical protein